MNGRSIPAGEFKARCLSILDEVAERQEEVIVTKRGKPIARVVPLRAPDSDEGQHGVVWIGDVESPTGVWPDPAEARMADA